MLSNLFRVFGRKTLYAVGGNALAAVAFGLSAFKPSGLDGLGLEIYQLGVRSLATGFVALSVRLLTWKPQP